MNYGKWESGKREKRMAAWGTKLRNKLITTVFLCVLIGIGMIAVAGISAGVGVWKGIIDSAPALNIADVTPAGYYSTVLANDGVTETAQLVASGANRKYVTIDEVPIDLQHAFVAIEDERFYEHNGIDIYGIGRAAVSGISRVLKGKSMNEGASTITQQLLKNNVLTSWTSETSFIEKLQRKVQEQYLAIELEKQVTKDWILENYMNTINLGANTLGVQAASEKYFGKDVSELTLSESAVIAGITQNPSAYNPITHPENNQKRRKKVLDNMLEQGYINQAEYDEAMEDDVYSRIAEHNSVQENKYNSYFVDALIDDVYDDLVEAGYSESDAYKLLYKGGLTIYSTQDLEIQEICDEEVEDLSNYDASTSYSFSLSFQVKKADGTYKTYTNNTMQTWLREKTGRSEANIDYSSEEACYDAINEYEQAMLEEGDELVDGTEAITITLEPQVAMTVIDQSTGEVKALVGGRGDKSGNRTWNRATDTTRQPGSTFKIIACYAAALDAGGKSLASTELDEPLTIGDWTVHNYNGSYAGYTSARKAITYSMNVVTVKFLQEIGVDLGYSYAEDFGITTLTDSDRNLSLCLGGLTNGVTNLELTGAYATIANGGMYLEPKFYTKVVDSNGNVILDKTETQESRRVISEETAWLLTSAMKDVMTSGTGTRAYFGSSMAQAGKSGTTTSNRDALFAGFTPYYTLVVWGGYDDNAVQSSTGYPKNLWRAVMSRLHSGLEYRDFEMPSGITRATVCADSGLLTSELCTNTVTEYFNSSNLPRESCSLHVKVTVCSESGLIPGPYCPEESVSEETFLKNETPTETCDIHTEEWYEEEQKKKEEETESEENGEDGAGEDGTGEGGTGEENTGGATDIIGQIFRVP